MFQCNVRKYFLIHKLPRQPCTASEVIRPLLLGGQSRLCTHLTGFAEQEIPGSELGCVGQPLLLLHGNIHALSYVTVVRHCVSSHQETPKCVIQLFLLLLRARRADTHVPGPKPYLT